MKKLLLPALFAATVFVIFSCKKTQVDAPAPENTQRYVTGIQNKEASDRDMGRIDNCLPTDVDLIAGQNMVAGTISVINDENNIYVTYTTTGGWVLTQTHLYVGDCALIPVNNPGNPIPGQFPYAGTHNNLTSVTYTVPLSRIPAGTCGCIAAHAVVKQLNISGGTIQTQTGWGNGVRINLNGGNWGMKFDYCSCVPEI